MADWEHDLTELVRTRHRALAGHAFLLCGNAKDAEDLVQDALVKVYEAGRRPGSTASPTEAYVRRAMVTLYVDGYRRRRRWSGVRHLVGQRETQRSRDDATVESIAVATALEALTPRQRACVVLRYFDDLTVPQVAEELDCAVGTVKRHLHDARKHLHDLLGPIDEDLDILGSSPEGPAHDAHRMLHVAPTPRSTS
ncbi:sigma-70 family RNA polymerase sigma factor [Sanguibacter sp. 25GB23B1]|uniref:sigma-70 family RNA polymerase sigma factor n=1 Tax=unclassified Sanguibacter TaxID=2645534 RepID=UPI0032AED486